jgi:hypothetical protein
LRRISSSVALAEPPRFAEGLLLPQPAGSGRSAIRIDSMQGAITVNDPGEADTYPLEAVGRFRTAPSSAPTCSALDDQTSTAQASSPTTGRCPTTRAEHDARP